MSDEITHLLKQFDYDHLPPPLRAVSKQLHDLAHDMATLPGQIEVVVGLRKLLEAKDCFVRARLNK